MSAQTLGHEDCTQNSNDQLSIDACTRALADPKSSTLDKAKFYFRRAGAYFAKGQLDLAIADYSASIKLNPKVALTFVNRAAAYDAKYNEDLEIADLNSAIQLEPNHAEWLARRAKAYDRVNKHALAIADYNTAIQLDPKSLEWLNERATSHDLNNEHDAAIADYTNLIKLDPRNPKRFFNRARSYQNHAFLDDTQYELALKDYTDAIRLDSRNPDQFTARAEVYMSLGNSDAAIADHTTAIQIDPKNGEHLEARARAYDLAKKHDLAIADYNRALEFDPKNLLWLQERASSHDENSEHDAAIADYTAAIKLDPSSPENFTERAQSHDKHKEHALAIADYTAAIQLDLKSVELLKTRAQSFTEHEEYDPAIADYTAAIRLEPEDQDLVAARADVLRKKGDIERALADYTRIIAANSDMSGAFIGRGDVYLSTGDFSSAMRDYVQAQKIDPDGSTDHLLHAEDIQSALTKCRKSPEINGTPNIDLRLYMTYCSEFLQENIRAPKLNGDVFAMRGIGQKLTGNFTEAISDLDKSIKLDSSSGEHFRIRGDIHLETGKFDAAIKDYSEAIALYRDDDRSSMARLWRGVAYGLNGNLAQAILDFKDGRYKGPAGKILREYANGWLLGFAYLRQNNLDEAAKAFTKFLKVRDPWILTERGRIRLAQGQYDQAISDFTAALALRTADEGDYFCQFIANHAEALEGRATAYERLGQSQRADDDRAQAKKITATTAGELRARAMVRLARSDYVGALADAEQAAKIDGFNWHWVHNIARAMAPAVVSQASAARQPRPSNTVVSYADDLPPESLSVANWTLNGQNVIIENVDRAAKTITLSGHAEGMRENGLNFLSTVSGTWTFWYANAKLQRFSQPYKSSFAIIAAIDDYDRIRDPQHRGPTGERPLSDMVKHAEELRRVLVETGFPDENIRTLYNEQATTQNINNALFEFWPGGIHASADRLFIYFGGHGGDTGQLGTGYLVTYDFDKTRPGQTGYLMNNFLYVQFPNITARAVMVALDACSSGLALPQTAAPEADKEVLRQFASLATIQEQADQKARNLLVAGIGREPAYVYGGGIFTKALVEGLRGGADFFNTGVIQFDELALYVSNWVNAWAHSIGVEQHPGRFVATDIGRGRMLFPLSSLK